MITELCKMWANTEARISRVEKSYAVFSVIVVACATFAEIAYKKQRAKIEALEKEIEMLKGSEGE